MLYRELIAALEPLLIGGSLGVDRAPDPTGLAYDSRKVEPGYAFFALDGTNLDGHEFIDAALAGGAAIVVGQEDMEAGGVTYLRVRDSRAALALAGHAAYGQPSQALRLIGVTGTSGKTTTTYALESILTAAGLKTGVIGTNNYRLGEVAEPASVTTPESLDLARLMAWMVREEARAAVMEVSSHALDQGRTWGCRFTTVGFTNLSRDHLDYHRDMEDYFQAKRRLLVEYQVDNRPAVNIDDPYGRRLAEELDSWALTYGLDPTAEVTAREVSLSGTGIRAEIVTPDGSFGLDSPLVGGFNLANLLAAAALAWSAGIDQAAIDRGLNSRAVVPGRMEDVGREFGRRVIVDYSHKVEALKRAMEVAGELSSGRLITLFGCGGDRDKGKRPMMGRAAAQASDLVILTSDNPRTEEPLKIIGQIREGVEEVGLDYLAPTAEALQEAERGFTEEPDRRAAIRLAVASAGPEDTVLIAGKGHEDYQILGTEKIHLDDREEARAALAEGADRV